MPTLPGAPQQPIVALPNGAARVLQLSGQISVMRKGDWWAVMPDTIVSPGQEILSGPDGHAILELQDTSRVEVFPNSHLIFRNNRGNLTDLIDLLLGKVRIHIEKFGGRPNPYQMNSPTALIAVRGTTFEVTNTEDNLTTVSVEEGAVDVTHRLRPTKTIRLSPGDSLTVYPNEQLSQNHVDRIRVGADVARRIAQQAINIWQRTGGGATPGTTAGTSTTASAPPTVATPTTPVGAGSGTTTPPTGGRPSGGTGSGDTGTGNPTPPTTGNGTGTGTGTGTGGTTPPTNAGPRIIKKSN